MNDLTFPQIIRRAEVLCARLGWEIEFLDIDEDGPRLDLRLRRRDGRWLHLRVDHLGRTSMERWHRTVALGPSRNHHGPQSPQIDDQFLGRQKLNDWREGLRTTFDYVCNNAQGQLTAAPELRALMGPSEG